jgi:2-amino-4-hydroxy-6-hydroxymethyldihydropteridine diphosphokinase
MAAKEVFLGLGSNQGNKIEYLTKSCGLVSEHIGTVIGLSSLYTTKAWGKTDQEDFVNQVIRVWTELEPKQLLNEITAIESRLGRKRTEKWGPRTIDIDILYYGNLIMDNEEIQIPHPELTERRFVLVPLVELAPDFLHPIFRLSNKELLAFCEDKLEVNKIENAA